MVFVARELGDGEVGGGLPTSSGQDLRPAVLALADVVAAGRAAFCWLNVIVEMQKVIRHHGQVGRASTEPEPGN
ncbi:MAG TPA: hypothetical protein VHF92_10860 [Geodermatophilus sp.]|nr:hypothetical protein [Geodermatophilus sp.]